MKHPHTLVMDRGSTELVVSNWNQEMDQTHSPYRIFNHRVLPFIIMVHHLHELPQIQRYHPLLMFSTQEFTQHSPQWIREMLPFLYTFLGPSIIVVAPSSRVTCTDKFTSGRILQHQYGCMSASLPSLPHGPSPPSLTTGTTRLRCTEQTCTL